jgi:hypothetical protein
MRLLSRRFRVIGVSVTSLHDLMEDEPDGVEVGLFRFSNRYHSQPSDRSITLELTRREALPGSIQVLVEGHAIFGRVE